MKRGSYGALIIGAMIFGCTGDGPKGPASLATVRDSAGIRVVESQHPQATFGDVVIDSVPAVRIGREESGPYQFGFISDVALFDDDKVAVAEVQAGQIRIFDQDGRHHMTLGGQGDGPGEFRTLTHVAQFGPDSLVGYDARLRRTTILPFDGGSPRTLPNSVDGNFSVFGGIENGPFLLYSPGGGYRPDLEPGAQWVETPIVAMDSESGLSDTIATLPDRWRVVNPDGNAPMPQPLLYAVQAVSRNGFYWGTPDEFEVKKYDRNGTLRLIIRRSAIARVVEPSMVQEYVRARLEEVRQRQGEEAVAELRTRLESEEYREELPYFNTGFVDREDRLWIGAYDWPDASGPVVWSVFSKGGEWMWDTRAPAGLQLFDATEDRVVGVSRDSLGVPFVQLHLLLRAGGHG